MVSIINIINEYCYMKKNKFAVLGINAIFNTFDKSRLYSEYAIGGVQSVGGFLGAILTLFDGGNPINTDANPNEAESWYKMRQKNLRSFQQRLDLLGQSEFCAWAAKEINKDKQFAYGAYSFIESGEIKENENLTVLKDAICKSLIRNNFKMDYSKPPPNCLKEFVDDRHYRDDMIIMKLQEFSQEDNKKDSNKLKL